MTSMISFSRSMMLVNCVAGNPTDCAAIASLLQGLDRDEGEWIQIGVEVRIGRGFARYALGCPRLQETRFASHTYQVRPWPLDGAGESGTFGGNTGLLRCERALV